MRLYPFAVMLFRVVGLLWLLIGILFALFGIAGFLFSMQLAGGGLRDAVGEQFWASASQGVGAIVVGAVLIVLSKRLGRQATKGLEE